MSRVSGAPGAVRVRSWWAKAWLRAVEEAADDTAALRRAARYVRAGRVGAVEVERGVLHALVRDDGEAWAPRVGVPPFDAADARVVAEAVAAEASRRHALAAGDLPHDLVEHCDELGVELLPSGGEFAAECACGSWQPVCLHALCLLARFAVDLDAEPVRLLRLRGVEPRAPEGPSPQHADLEVAWQASVEARALIATDSAGVGPHREADGSGTLGP